jgi:hypothetical protein
VTSEAEAEDGDVGGEMIAGIEAHATSIATFATDVTIEDRHRHFAMKEATIGNGRTETGLTEIGAIAFGVAAHQRFAQAHLEGDPGHLFGTIPVMLLGVADVVATTGSLVLEEGVECTLMAVASLEEDAAGPRSAVIGLDRTARRTLGTRHTHRGPLLQSQYRKHERTLHLLHRLPRYRLLDPLSVARAVGKRRWDQLQSQYQLAHEVRDPLPRTAGAKNTREAYSGLTQNL